MDDRCSSDLAFLGASVWVGGLRFGNSPTLALAILGFKIGLLYCFRQEIDDLSPIRLVKDRTPAILGSLGSSDSKLHLIRLLQVLERLGHSFKSVMGNGYLYFAVQ